MKYTSENAKGDAAEFLFAFRVAQELKWPCRLLDIDIGIDAQVEIIGAGDNSTGLFVAVQVKGKDEVAAAISKALREETEDALALARSEAAAVSKVKQNNNQVKEAFPYTLRPSKAHVDYWQSVDVPVFIAQVDVSENEIYLVEINKHQDYLPANGKGNACVISFEKAHKFGASTKKYFNDAADTSNVVINEVFESIEHKIKIVDHAVNGENSTMPEIHEGVEAWLELTQEFGSISVGVLTKPKLLLRYRELHREATDALKALHGHIRSVDVRGRGEEHLAKFYDDDGAEMRRLLRAVG